MTAIITTHSCMTLFFHLLPLSTPLIYAPGCVGRDLCVEEGITLQYVPLQSSDDDDDDGSASLRYVLLMFSIDDNIKLGDPLHRTDCWPVSTILTHPLIINLQTTATLPPPSALSPGVLCST